LRGAVSADDDACPFARTPRCAAPTDEGCSGRPPDARGRFDAELTIPLQVEVGDYRDGDDARCRRSGASR
jgi:hypothetical protein